MSDARCPPCMKCGGPAPAGWHPRRACGVCGIKLHGCCRKYVDHIKYKSFCEEHMEVAAKGGP